MDSYVGKLAHGNYHDTCCASGCGTTCLSWVPGSQCAYFLDFRDPVISWSPHNLYPIDAAFSSNEKIQSHGERDSCGQGNCKDGCSENESDI